jgi:hypothetical protein
MDAISVARFKIIPFIFLSYVSSIQIGAAGSGVKQRFQ